MQYYMRASRRSRLCDQSVCLSVCQDGHRPNLVRMGWGWPAGNGRILVLIRSWIWMQDDISTFLAIARKGICGGAQVCVPSRTRVNFLLAIVRFRGAYEACLEPKKLRICSKYVMHFCKFVCRPYVLLGVWNVQTFQSLWIYDTILCI